MKILQELKTIKIKKHKSNKVNHLNFNPIDKYIILSSTYSGEIHIWNIIKNDSLNELNFDSITSIASISWYKS